MNKVRLLILPLLIISFSLIVIGCASTPKPIGNQHIIDDGGKVYGNITLSAERIAEIRQAFIGRSFVFKEDWYEYALIDSDPLGGFSDLIPLTKLPKWAEKRGHRKMILRAGTAAKIVGTKFYRDGMAFICEAETGGKAYVKILNQRSWTLLFGRHTGTAQRDALKDKKINIPWVQHNLTYHTMEFVENLPDLPDMDISLPTPPQEPKLTPVTGIDAAPHASMLPSIVRLNIHANPPQVRNNQVLSLILDYTVDTAGQSSILVTETRTLQLNGKTLPNYPKTSNLSQSNGHHSTNFDLTIPPRAQAGSYSYKGEVCVLDDCVSRSKKFQIIP